MTVTRPLARGMKPMPRETPFMGLKMLVLRKAVWPPRSSTGWSSFATTPFCTSETETPASAPLTGKLASPCGPTVPAPRTRPCASTSWITDPGTPRAVTEPPWARMLPTTRTGGLPAGPTGRVASSTPLATKASRWPLGAAELRVSATGPEDGAVWLPRTMPPALRSTTETIAPGGPLVVSRVAPPSTGTGVAVGTAIEEGAVARTVFEAGPATDPVRATTLSPGLSVSRAPRLNVPLDWTTAVVVSGVPLTSRYTVSPGLPVPLNR